MKHLHIAPKALTSVIFLTSVLSLGAVNSLADCTQTGFIREGSNLTAAMINPAGTVSSTIDAKGCDIGIYYGPKNLAVTGTVSGAKITGAHGFGIVNDGANVTIQDTIIHDIGLTEEFSGEGYGIYFAIGSGAQGSITGNFVWNYGIAGIVVDGGLPAGQNASVPIMNNSVTGLGPNTLVAQTAIQLGYGAVGTVSGNTITSNNYDGTNGGLGIGILVAGGPCYNSSGVVSPLVKGIHVENNILVANNVGIATFNLDSSCNASTTDSNFHVRGNLIHKYGVTNKTGYSISPEEGYQAGIWDVGKNDAIEYNNICGNGYSPVTPPPYLYFIDTTLAISPNLVSNVTKKACPIGGPDTSAGVDSDSDGDGPHHGPFHPGGHH